MRVSRSAIENIFLPSISAGGSLLVQRTPIFGQPKDSGADETSARGCDALRRLWQGRERQGTCLDGANLALEDSQIVIGLGIVGRGCDGGLQHLQRIRRTPLRREDHRQIVQALREVGPQLQRSLVARKRPCAHTKKQIVRQPSLSPCHHWPCPTSALHHPHNPKISGLPAILVGYYRWVLSAAP